MVHRNTMFKLLLRSRNFRRYSVTPKCSASCFMDIAEIAGSGLKIKVPLYERPASEKSVLCTLLQIHRRISTSSKCLSSQKNDSDYEGDSDSDIGVSDLHEPHLKANEHKLFSSDTGFNSDDPIMLRLAECVSLQEVFDIVVQHRNEFNIFHTSQAIFVLWELQKTYNLINVTEPYDEATDSVADPNALLEEYVRKVNSHEAFSTLIDIVQSTVGELSVDAASCTLLYLQRMGVPLETPVMEKLVSHCEMLFDRLGNQTPLSAVSKFSIAMFSKMKMWPELVNLLPFITDKLNSPLTVEEMRLLTVCMSKLFTLISLDTLELYRKKLWDMLKNRSFTASDHEAIVRIATFLNLPTWAWRNTDLLKELLSVLKGNLSLLSSEEIVYVHRVFHDQLEPADILKELQEQASRRLSQKEDFTTAFYTAANLLCCVALFVPPNDKLALEQLTFQHLKKTTTMQVLPTLFKIIRNLKTSNIDLCNAFWSKVVDVLSVNPEERTDLKLLRFCHRYMHFNNNLAGTYRHYQFENKMIDWLLDHIQNGSVALIPTKFSRAAAFLIAYGNLKRMHYRSILAMVVEKLNAMSCQLSELDCLNISHGYQVAVLLAPRAVYHTQVVNIFVELDSILNTCARNHLKSDCNLSMLNILTKSYLKRRGPRSTDLFQKLIERYGQVSGEVNSILIKDLSISFLLSKCLIPKSLNDMADYVINHKKHLLGHTVGKLLYTGYTLGYTPENTDIFFEVAVEILNRDKDKMDGLSLMQAALALCFYRNLPQDLVHFIFTVQFLERLDEEISTCYSKASYPYRLRTLMMELNRAVCLDYPEADIPWFHKKYVEQIRSLEPAQTSFFSQDVKAVIVDVLGSKHLLRADVFVPYGYKIDYEILMNERSVPVSTRHLTDKNITKIAIVMRDEDSYTSNVRVLRGSEQLKQRHLEMLGYKVIDITSTMWNAMYMSETGAKYDFIKSKIFPHQVLPEPQFN